jgi:hypothetical protein
MNQEELIQEINRLPLRQRVEIARAVLESVRQEEHDAEAQVNDSQEKRAALERLRGILKFEDGPPTDEEVKDMITDYLTEKYS